MKSRAHFVPLLVALLVVLPIAGCGGGGGGGGGDGSGNPSTPDTGDDSGVVPGTQADLEVVTYATTSTNCVWARVDLFDSGPRTSDPLASVAPNPGKRALLQTLKGTIGDLSGNSFDANGDGIVDAGFDDYDTGLNPGNVAGRILAANNLYDLFQTTWRAPGAGSILPIRGFSSMNALTGAGGGPGLLSGASSTAPNGSSANGYPILTPLPNTMGDLDLNGNGRGPSPTDEHQFIQIVFPYDLDPDSLFDPSESTNSFLGDGLTGSDNVEIEARWVEADPADLLGIGVDQSFQRKHVPGIAIIGGEAAIPFAGGRATVSLTDSFLPEGVLELVNEPNVLTYIAHESPGAINTGTSELTGVGRLRGDGVLILPNPTTGLGGRVFGANSVVPSSVNDFGSTGGDSSAAVIGFVMFKLRTLRTAAGATVTNPYFHTFPVSQANVGSDPRAPFVTVPTTAAPNPARGNFNRGAAVFVDPATQIPRITLLDPSKHALGTFVQNPVSDAVNLISTRPVFRVDFDREVIPDSVGWSRRHTAHRTSTQGVIFTFRGNVRPNQSPASQLAGTIGAPVAPSIYVAVNVPATQRVNDPFFNTLSINGAGLPALDDGTTLSPGTAGLNPQQQNTLATLPRGVIPCDIYPLNQNNLQSYVIEPLVELPPNSVVTVGVCVQGYEGFQPAGRNNVGNQTRSGTVFTTDQGLNGFGLVEDNSLKQSVIPNDTIIKVNPGPMDLQGNLFYGGTTVSIDIQMDADPTITDSGGNLLSNDALTGRFNVARTFRVGGDHLKEYVNAPVAPQALYLGFAGQGAGVLDLAGTGFTTNIPGGALLSPSFKNYLIISQWLSPQITGLQSGANYNPQASVAGGGQFPAFGLLGRYTAGLPESDGALGAPIPVGFATPTPGVNEGSSGFETLVYHSPTSTKAASPVMTDGGQIGQVRDMVLGDFLDKRFFDVDNPFANASQHRSFNDPGGFGGTGALASNSIADPPLPNPPPLRLPVGLPATRVVFDQSDLTKDPFIIQGTEVFAAEHQQKYNDGTGFGASGARLPNRFIQLNPTSNASNPSDTIDVPPLPLAGFTNVFDPNLPPFNYVQTGPPPETSTAYASILSLINAGALGSTNNTFKEQALYQARQQIGNFLFIADGLNKAVQVVNSNSMEVMESIPLPDPYGLGIAPDLERLFVSNEDDNTVSVIDVDPDNATFLNEITRIPVGFGPRGVAAQPDGEDVFVCNFVGNSVSVIDPDTNTVRRTLITGSINRPWDAALGPRESGFNIAFGSGTYHGFISNNGGNNVLVFEGGPDGLNGVGFDNIIGTIEPDITPQPGDPTFSPMIAPRGIAFDPAVPLDSVTVTIGAFVAHRDEVGDAMVTRVAYTKDSNPGAPINFGQGPNFGSKTFEVFSQYRVVGSNATALDVCLPDYNREIFEEETWADRSDLFNFGNNPNLVPLMPRNTKYVLVTPNAAPFGTNVPRYRPDRIYVSVDNGTIAVFDIDDDAGQSGPSKIISTGSSDVTKLASYFRQ